MYLAREGAKMEGLLENSVAGKASVGGALLAWSRLWPVIQEYHFGTIYGVRLQNSQHPSHLIIPLILNIKIYFFKKEKKQ